MTAHLRAARILLFAGLCAPAIWLGYAIVVELMMPGAALGADPGEAVVRFLGEWGIRALLLTLCVSPLRRLTGATWLIRFRRMIGLFAYAYLSLHFLAYLAFFTEFDGALIAEDIFERPYITVGFTAFVILTALALTSTRGWQRRLARGWQRLHRGIYAAMALGLLHLWWLTREGYGEFVLYLAIALVLATERIISAGRARVARSARASAP